MPWRPTKLFDETLPLTLTLLLECCKRRAMTGRFVAVAAAAGQLT